VRLTGDIALSVEELESISEGMGLAGTFSLALVAVLLVVGLRSARLIVATLVTLLAGLAWTAFFALAVIGEFNLISVAFAVLFIGLGVDFGIHFALRYREALAEHESFAALRSAAGRVGSPLALTAVAAAVGFFSFAPTHFRGLAELGIIAGSGMFIALFATLTLMPALIAAMPHSTGTPPPGRSTLGAAMRDAVDGNARAVVAAAALLGLAGLAAVPYARFDNNPLALKDPGSESVQTLDVLQERENFSLYGAQVVASDLEAAAETADRLKALPEVHRAITLRSFVPGEQEAKLDIIDTMSLFLLPVLQAEEGAPPSAAEKRAALADLRGALEGLSEDVAGAGLAAAAGRLASAVGTFLNRFGDSAAAVDALESDLMTYWPGRLERLVQALQAGEVELADIPRNLVDRYLSDDGRVRVEVIPAADLGAGEALSRFVEAVRGVAPDAVGQAIQILESGRVVARAIRDATAIALTAIAALLLALLRKPFDAALVMLPVALAGSLTVGSSVLLGIPFNFANVIVLPLLLGLGVAGGIHLVMRQRGEAENRMLGTITPRAVLFSALTTVGSFSSLALSSHQGTASMGKLLTIAIAWTLCATLIVLPAVATLRERRTARMTEAKEA